MWVCLGEPMSTLLVLNNVHIIYIQDVHLITRKIDSQVPWTGEILFFIIKTSVKSLDYRNNILFCLTSNPGKTKLLMHAIKKCLIIVMKNAVWNWKNYEKMIWTKKTAYNS